MTPGPKTGDLFLTGAVRRGIAPVPGATVVADLMSTEDVKIGHEAPTWDAKPVKTDSKGRCAIRLDPDEVPGKFYGADDFLNVDRDVTVDTLVASWGSAPWLVGHPRVWRTEQPDRVAPSWT